MSVESLLLDLLLGFAIGLTLGLLGGGGSILTVPALVYLVGQPPQAAVTTSLAIVGLNSAAGVLFHRQSAPPKDGARPGGALNGRVALLFGGAGMITAYLAAGLSRDLNPDLLMVLFALLMLGVGALMLLKRQPEAREGDARPAPRQTNPWLTLGAGALTGALTGILGVGGGFLIVPMLVMLIGLPMYQAVGTSLVIIAANSFAGLLGHLNMPFDPWLTAVFVLAGIGGTYAGAKLAHHLPARRLRQIFAGFVILLAIFLLIDNFPKLLF